MSDLPTVFLDVRRDGDATIARLTVDRLTEDQNLESFGHELLRLAEQPDGRRVILDLRQVEFVTSSVLGKMITLHRRLHRNAGRLTLCGIGDGLDRVLRTSRLFDYFHTATDVDAALTQVE